MIQDFVSSFTQPVSVRLVFKSPRCLVFQTVCSGGNSENNNAISFESVVPFVRRY